jgi:hypothetical protein
MFILDIVEQKVLDLVIAQFFSCLAMIGGYLSNGPKIRFFGFWRYALNYQEFFKLLLCGSGNCVHSNTSIVKIIDDLDDHLHEGVLS